MTDQALSLQTFNSSTLQHSTLMKYFNPPSMFVLLMVAFLPLVSYGQFGKPTEKMEDPHVRDIPFKERIFVGGFLGLQLGTFTAINVSAHSGLRITNRLSAGIGGSYQFANDKWFNQSYTSHTYGGSVFARFRVIGDGFIHAENEWLNLMSRLDRDKPGDRRRISEQNQLLGVGYGLRMSPRARFNILVLYNFNTTSQAYFDNPFFRAGIDIYLR